MFQRCFVSIYRLMALTVFTTFSPMMYACTHNFQHLLRVHSIYAIQRAQKNKIENIWKRLRCVRLLKTILWMHKQSAGYHNRKFELGSENQVLGMNDWDAFVEIQMSNPDYDSFSVSFGFGQKWSNEHNRPKRTLNTCGTQFFFFFASASDRPYYMDE